MTQQEDRKFNRIQKGKSCVGYAEFKDNCWNFSIISTHEHSDVLTNEYLAGFIQGELQGEDMIRASRNKPYISPYVPSGTERLEESGKFAEKQLPFYYKMDKRQSGRTGYWQVCESDRKAILSNVGYIRCLVLRVYTLH